MIRAVNEGVPLVTSRPSSPAAAALRQVAQTVMGIDTRPLTPAKPERRSIFGRRSQPDERGRRRPPGHEARADGR